MRTLILRGWILAVVVEWLVASPGHAGPSVIRDRAFLDADWTLTTFGVGNGGSVEADQASMGNPAPSRRIRTMVNSAPSPSEFSSVTGVNLFGGAVYDPQAQGAFVDLDYFEDALLEQGFGDGQATGIALRQNGNVYVRQVGTTPEFAWTAKKISGVTATQFALVFEGGEDVNVHPDFSASGAPIEFGFMRRNSTSVGANGYQIVALIDNWTVLINTPCAQDADCVYPDACFPGSCVSGVCTATMLACDDGDPCTIDACVDGVCSGTPVACDDGDPCTVDACDAGGCAATPIECDDGLACTVDYCDGGGCSNVLTFDTVEAAITTLLAIVDRPPCASDGIADRTRKKLVKRLTKARDTLARADAALKERLLGRLVGRADRLLDIANKAIVKAEGKSKVTPECAAAVRSYLTDLATTCADGLPHTLDGAN